MPTVRREEIADTHFCVAVRGTEWQRRAERSIGLADARSFQSPSSHEEDIQGHRRFRAGGATPASWPHRRLGPIGSSASNVFERRMFFRSASARRLPPCRAGPCHKRAKLGPHRSECRPGRPDARAGYGHDGSSHHRGHRARIAAPRAPDPPPVVAPARLHRRSRAGPDDRRDLDGGRPGTEGAGCLPPLRLTTKRSTASGPAPRFRHDCGR